MHTRFLSALLICTSALQAQTVATFENLSLPGQDTFYQNYSQPGQDVGFNNGLAHFTHIADTAFGGYWYGFTYSNMRDSVTPGPANEGSAITASGFGGSSQYAVAYGGVDFVPLGMSLTGAARGQRVSGFYITNTTFAYRSMKFGDQFTKKFGGASGNDPDYLRLIIHGFRNGAMRPDSVTIYLADFRSANNSQDSILRSWKWVNLMPLGKIDSLGFRFESSDTTNGFINTPTYFAMDQFTTDEQNLSVPETDQSLYSVSPNPASTQVSIQGRGLQHAELLDACGRAVRQAAAAGSAATMSVADLPAGIYLLHLSGREGEQYTRIVRP